MLLSHHHHPRSYLKVRHSQKQIAFAQYTNQILVHSCPSMQKRELQTAMLQQHGLGWNQNCNEDQVTSAPSAVSVSIKQQFDRHMKTSCYSCAFNGCSAAYYLE